MPDDNTTRDDGNAVTEEELERQAERAVDEGRSIEKIKSLLEDNYQLREDRRELRGKLPDENEVVLGEEEASRLRELGALSEDGEVQASEVAERLEEAEEAEEELQAYRQREQRRQVYDATGMNEEAAEDILPSGVEYEVETETNEDGDEEKVAFVVTEDGRTPVKEHVQENYSEPIQNALFSETEDGEEDVSSGKAPPQQTPAGEDEPSGGEPNEEEIRQQKRSQINYGV
jgi:hypothetical protein